MAQEKQSKYSFSFLAGALYLPESLAIANLFHRHNDWDKIREEVARHNLLRQRSKASETRMFREIRYRLEALNAKELDFLCSAGSRDQRQMLFIALCRRFPFIREFVEEMLRPKVLAMDTQLYPTDFARFFDRKGADDPKIDKLTPKSQAKIRQVMIRMFADAGLLNSTSSRQILRVTPSKALVALIADNHPRDLRCLLLSDQEIRQLTS
ncbi:MAG TPA: DUF1819 family protein [Verrucomicrobiae bacterium]|nr:DUF1819 family protein [Verrucomicrobiae bacterium]